MIDTYTKTIDELEKRKGQIQKELSLAESVVGKALFAAGDIHAGTESAAAYAALQHDIDDLENRTNDIFSAAEKRQSLQRTLESVKKEKLKLDLNWNSLYESLGNACADAGPDNGVEGFEVLYKEIVSLRVQLHDAQNMLDTTGMQAETASIWTMVKDSFVRKSKQNSVRQLEKRLSVLYIKAGRLIYSSGVLNEQYEQNALSVIVQDSYRKCRELTDSITSYDVRIKECSEQISEITNSFAKNGVTGSVERFISGLRHELDEKKKMQVSLCQTSGRAFCNLYLLPDGEVLTSYEPASDAPSELADMKQLLERVRCSRVNLADCQHSIDMQHVTHDLEQIEKKLGNMRNALAANCHEIEEIEQRNTEIKKKMSEIETEKGRLVLKRSELEKTAAKTVKQLTEQELQM